jgi:predicted Zn-dependent protease
MPRPELTAFMRGVALSLGVRCNHCHVVTGQDANGREEFDYSLDDKDTKKTAREMLRMVMDINEKYLPAMGRTITASNRVSCETCHHGLSKPQTLRAALAGAVEAKGADSAIALYRDLRTKYYGRASYDFGELSLNDAANEIARMPNQRSAAIALVKLNLEFYPQSVMSFTTLAQMSLQAGDTATAVDALNKAIAIQPENPQLKNMLNRVKRP